jgi:hypothetical protein
MTHLIIAQELFPLVYNIQSPDELASKMDDIIKIITADRAKTCIGVFQTLSNDGTTLKPCNYKTTHPSGKCKIHVNSVLGEKTNLSEKGKELLAKLLEKKSEVVMKETVEDAPTRRKRGGEKPTPIIEEPIIKKKRITPKEMRDFTALFGTFGMVDDEASGATTPLAV